MRTKPSADGPASVTVSAWHSNGHVVLDYYAQPTNRYGLTRPVQKARILVRVPEVLTAQQLTRLVGMMAAYVLVAPGPSSAVPQGLLWRPYDQPAEGPVPPGGGEGGEIPTRQPLTVRPIPEQRKRPYNQIAPGRARGQREARNRSSGLDLPAGWWEEPLDWSDLDRG